MHAGSKVTAVASHFENELERCLREGLGALTRVADECGVDSVSVILLESEEVIQVVYRWPGNAPFESSRLAGGRSALAGVTGATRIDVESPIGQLLNRVASRVAGSFLVFPWDPQRVRGLIAFGFVAAGADAAAIPRHGLQTLELAAWATWATCEIRRLRRDLRVANERLSGRKTVERAKGLLQARHGWDEQKAYEHLRNLSRRRRRAMEEVAQELLRAAHPT